MIILKDNFKDALLASVVCLSSRQELELRGEEIQSFDPKQRRLFDGA